MDEQPGPPRPSFGIASGFESWWSTESSRSCLPAEGLVTLDANVLLAMYRVTAGARGQILDVLGRLEGKLWLTHQAALEFNRARTDVVSGRVSKFQEARQSLRNASANAIAELRSAVEKLVELRRDNMSEREWTPDSFGLSEEDLHARLKGLMDPALEELARLEAEHDLSPALIHTSDPILPQLEGITRGKVGAPYDHEMVRRLVAEAAEFRYPNKIPPGYADGGKKKSDYLEAGDYILWRQLLDRARLLSSPATISFVTLDTKEDWWLLSGKKKPLRARPELCQEMSDLTGVMFETLTLSSFLEEAAEQYPGQVSEETVEEVRETEAESAMTIDIEALRIGVDAALAGYATNLLRLSPSESEHLIARLMRVMGLEATVTDMAGDGGVDIIAIDRGEPFGGMTTVIQVKRWRPQSPISAHDVRAFYAAVLHANAGRGLFVTTSRFTQSAREFAAGKPLVLVDGGELIALLKQHLDMDAVIE
jgi:HJR/Mrr/RecB family endonuclease